MTETIPAHVSQTIHDLEAMRDELTRTLDNLQKLFVPAEASVAPPVDPSFRFTKPKKTVRAYKKRDVVQREPVTVEALETPTPKRVQPSIRDLIREVVHSGRGLNALAIADMIVSDHPGLSTQSNISTQICQLISAGEFRKLDDLTIVPARNGAHA